MCHDSYLVSFYKHSLTFKYALTISIFLKGVSPGYSQFINEMENVFMKINVDNENNVTILSFVNKNRL